MKGMACEYGRKNTEPLKDEVLCESERKNTLAFVEISLKYHIPVHSSNSAVPNSKYGEL